MCIAILTLPGKKLTKEIFEKCWASNSHGAGLAYSNGKEMVVVKELLSVNRFWRLYNRHYDLAGGVPMLVHFRIRTHGKVNLLNTQPIPINHRVVYIHNGTIGKVPTSPDYSDTVMFKKHYLAHLPNGFHLRTPYTTFIKEFIGTWNKLVFLDVKNRYSIVNEKDGNWEDGIWYSNYTWRPAFYNVPVSRCHAPTNALDALNIYDKDEIDLARKWKKSEKRRRKGLSRVGETHIYDQETNSWITPDEMEQKELLNAAIRKTVQPEDTSRRWLLRTLKSNGDNAQSCAHCMMKWKIGDTWVEVLRSTFCCERCAKWIEDQCNILRIRQGRIVSKEERQKQIDDLAQANEPKKEAAL